MAVGRYELVYELAHSYLGPLWAVHSESGDGASHVGLLRQVSLARLDADTRVRLLEAAWQAIEIRHERICPVTDVVASDGELGVVSEYIEGQTLRGLQGLASVRRAPMSISVALRILIDVAEAVTGVHRAYVEFGDEAVLLYGGVSADSVIVGTNGHAYLTDVALSSASSFVESLGDNPDRIAYSAPEQVSSPPIADARTDVFAVGILAWELLSNRRLFLGSDKAVTQKVLVAKIPRLDEVKRRGDFEIPDALLGCVMKALEREPRARFQSIDGFLEALRQCNVTPAEESVVGAYVQTLADGVLDRTRDALKDSAAGRVELGSRVQTKLPLPEERAASPVPEKPKTKTTPDSLTDTVPIPGGSKRGEPIARPVTPAAAAAPSPAPPQATALAPLIPEPKPESPKPKPVATGAKPRPIAFELKPRLPVQAEPKPKPVATDSKPRTTTDAKPFARRATMLGMAPAAAAAVPAAVVAARKPAAQGAPPPVTTAQTATSPLAGKHRARQATMIGIPPPAPNAAPVQPVEAEIPMAAPAPSAHSTPAEPVPLAPPAPAPPSQSAKSVGTKQVIFDSIPPPPDTSTAPTPPHETKIEEEPTGQYDADDLLRQFETMGRRTDPGKAPPDFPEPPTKPRVAIPAPVSSVPADGGWLDGPDDPATVEPKAEPSPQPMGQAAEERAPAAAPAQAPRTATKPPPASLPRPAHLLPSQIPPPLIHDPRANRSRTARPGSPDKAPSRARNLILGFVASVIIAGASAAIGIVALGGRNPISTAPQPPAPTTQVVVEQPAAAEPTPAASAEAAEPMAAATEAPGPSAEAPDTAQAGGGMEAAPTPTEAPAPTAATTAATGKAPPAPGAAPRAVVKVAAPAPASPPPKKGGPAGNNNKKKKNSRYVPDDI